MQANEENNRRVCLGSPSGSICPLEAAKQLEINISKCFPSIIFKVVWCRVSHNGYLCHSTTHTPTLCEIYIMKGLACCYVSAIWSTSYRCTEVKQHSSDESHREEKTRDEGEQSGTSTPHPFKYWWDGAPLCCCLCEVSYTEETQSKDTRFSTQKSVLHKHVETDTGLYRYCFTISLKTRVS